MDPEKLFKGIVVAQIIMAVISLAVLGVVIYVACHFIAKVW